jgi:hypothetical protein
MDEFGQPDHRLEDELGLTTVLLILASVLSLFACLISFSEMAQIGPDVGEMVSFDPRNGPRYWSQPGIPAVIVQFGKIQPRTCVLMPSIMAADGGSLVIEAKETSRPPLFHVHWSGPHTAAGAEDCGKSADLMLQLVQLRALANVAGGYGVYHLQYLF